MQQLVRTAVYTWIALACSLANAQVSGFEFRPQKIQTGIAYHYVKTNIDGTDPENISVYVFSMDQLQVFKFHEPGTRAGYVIADMDWKNFQAGTLNSYAVLSETEQKLAARLKFLPEQKQMEVEIPAQNRSRETIAFDFLPTHIYNFDLTSLNFSFRHLKNPHGRVTIGLADPTFSEQGPSVRYRGEVQIQYIGDEKRNMSDCRKYSIAGPGLDHRGGFLWVHKVGEYFEDLEIEVPDNPAWKTFKLALKKTEMLTPDQWEQFRQNHFRK